MCAFAYLRLARLKKYDKMDESLIVLKGGKDLWKKLNF